MLFFSGGYGTYGYSKSINTGYSKYMFHPLEYALVHI